MADYSRLRLAFMKLNPAAELPQRQHPDDAGMDVKSIEDVTIPPGGIALISTGIAFQFMQHLMHYPDGVNKPFEPRTDESHATLEIQVRSRSGMAAKHGVFVLNSPGTLDMSYRGEIKVILMNGGRDPFSILAGDRIAQLVVSEVLLPPVSEVKVLEVTDRGVGGFGSTGVK